MEPIVDTVAQARRDATEKVNRMREESNTIMRNFMDDFPEDPEVFKQRQQETMDTNNEYHTYAQKVNAAENAHANALQEANQTLAQSSTVEGFMQGLPEGTDEAQMQDVIARVLAGYKATVKAADEAYIAAVS